LYLGRFSDVHIGGPSSNQATSLESQMIHPTQLLPGRTLNKIFCWVITDHAGETLSSDRDAWTETYLSSLLYEWT
jgi:hypothetical protein